MSRNNQSGTRIAVAAPEFCSVLSSHATVRELLDLVPKRRTGPNVHSAVAAFLNFLGTTAEETALVTLDLEQEGFGVYLASRPYSKVTVRSYRYAIVHLFTIAKTLGWSAPPKIITSDWALVVSLTGSKAMVSIARHAVRSGRKPSTYTEDDLAAWCQEQVKGGKKLDTARQSASCFRALLSKPDLAHLNPLIQRALPSYGVALAQMHPYLRDEVESVISYRTDPFHPDRDGKPIRKPTAAQFCHSIERITGFVQNVCGRPQVESLSALLTKNNVAGFVQWVTSERKVTEGTIFGCLAGIIATFRNHPDYHELNLSWIKAMMKQLQPEQRIDIDRRKQKKLISFADADNIPKKILEVRCKAKALSAAALAISHRDELLMLWLVILPWRQRNLRECRLIGGAHPNLYHKPVQPQSAATQPKWLSEREGKNPGTPFWQIYFTPKETKSKNGVTGFLPYELTVKLEEYLAHRDALIAEGLPDPGTLFLTNDGKAMSSAYIRTCIKELTSRHAGVAVNPHLFRDIVAYEWLNQNPSDYVTLSKLLWHRNLEYTLKVYGSRFDESTGIARMDDWRLSR